MLTLGRVAALTYIEIMDLEAYHLSSSFGFIPSEPPLLRLPARYEAWEQLLDRMTDLIKERQLREEVAKLPLLIVTEKWLKDKRHLERAACVLTFLSQGYMWCRGEEETVGVLPRQLAVPWWEVSHRLGLPPVMTYSIGALWNWHLRDPNQPLSLSNLAANNTFTGTHDEEWFYTVSVAIELAAAPGIKASVTCLEAVRENRSEDVVENLNHVRGSIKAMLAGLERMYEHTDPQIFFDDIRPFQAGTKSLKAFKDGLIYEGVSDEPKKYGGGSGVQTSTLPVFDILLGVEHEGTQKEFLDMQRWYMPREHRQFLVALGSSNAATTLRTGAQRQHSSSGSL